MKHIETNKRRHIQMNVFKYRIEYTIGHKISYIREKYDIMLLLKKKRKEIRFFFPNQETYRDDFFSPLNDKTPTG